MSFFISNKIGRKFSILHQLNSIQIAGAIKSIESNSPPSSNWQRGNQKSSSGGQEADDFSIHFAREIVGRFRGFLPPLQCESSTKCPSLSVGHHSVALASGCGPKMDGYHWPPHRQMIKSLQWRIGHCSRIHCGFLSSVDLSRLCVRHCLVNIFTPAPQEWRKQTKCQAFHSPKFHRFQQLEALDSSWPPNPPSFTLLKKNLSSVICQLFFSSSFLPQI